MEDKECVVTIRRYEGLVREVLDQKQHLHSKL